MTEREVRGRFAPSPTGEMHLGNAWTALLAWLQIRQLGGKMVLRVEDLDPSRSRPEYIELLIKDMRWLGLDWDEGPDVGGPFIPYCQNDRRLLYDNALEKLQFNGDIYPCYCTRAELHSVATAPHFGEQEHVYPGTCRRLDDEQRLAKETQRRPALRLAIRDETVIFEDGLHGRIVQNIKHSCGDFVVRRSDGIHAYQLAVVVDDGLMEISHVLRGDDLLDSTPRQLLLYRQLGLVAPNFTHIPLLYGVDGHRLSKRHSSLSLASLRIRKVNAERVIGYLAWKAGLLNTWEEVQAQDLIQDFSLSRISKTPIVVSENF